jgi:sugar/nucleoside kinase (ribokinase family)
VHDLATKLTYDDIPIGWTDAPLVHLAPLVEEVPPDIVHQFPNSTVMLTPQGWLRQWDDQGRVSFKRWFDEDVLRAVDIIVFSKPDIADAPEMEQAFARVVKHCLVTDGANGGVYYYEGEPRPYFAQPAQEIDPTGAGDVFATALLASLPFLDHNMDAAISVAAHLAAVSVTHAGVVTFTPDDIARSLTHARQEFL